MVSVEKDNLPEILAINAASMALCLSSIPYTIPVAAVQIGLIDGNFVVNPNAKEREESIMHLTVCATKEKVMMIEAGGNEIPEDTMIKAIEYGFERCQDIISFQEEAMATMGKEKEVPELYHVDLDVEKDITEFAGEMVQKAMYITDKDERNLAIDEINEKVSEEFGEKYADKTGDIKEALYNMQKKVVRHMLLKEKRRPDGRAFDEVRPISCEVGILPRTHGTGLFTRGLTQVMTVATLGSVGDIQVLDGIDESETTKRYMHHYNFPGYSVGEVKPLRGPGRREIGHGALAERALEPLIPSEDTKRYMHHYNFPGYSVGEVKPLRGPGRREIGHGALAERALEPLIPSEEEFPYTIRLVSEVLSSNGSTSQASVCGSTLALLDAGVPIKRPAAGIAMGLITSEDLRD